jgi:hypothetical protein
MSLNRPRLQGRQVRPQPVQVLEAAAEREDADPPGHVGERHAHPRGHLRQPVGDRLRVQLVVDDEHVARRGGERVQEAAAERDGDRQGVSQPGLAHLRRGDDVHGLALPQQPVDDDGAEGRVRFDQFGRREDRQPAAVARVGPSVAPVGQRLGRLAVERGVVSGIGVVHQATPPAERLRGRLAALVGLCRTPVCAAEASGPLAASP